MACKHMGILYIYIHVYVYVCIYIHLFVAYVLKLQVAGGNAARCAGQIPFGESLQAVG